MALIHVDVVTAERAVLSSEADSVTAMTVEGQISVLPGHVPLVTLLQPGELVVRVGGEETLLAVAGGFLEVSREGIVVLADACERAEEIDIERAALAKRRAQALIEAGASETDAAAAEAALRRAVARLRVAEGIRIRPRRNVRPMS